MAYTAPIMLLRVNSFLECHIFHLFCIPACTARANLYVELTTIPRRFRWCNGEAETVVLAFMR